MAKIDYGSWQEGGSPCWASRPRDADTLVPGGAILDAPSFPRTEAVNVSLTAAALAGATSITVAALAKAIPSGATLDFGGAKFARLTANAAVGATTLTVAALPTALASGDTAIYNNTGRRYVPSGTVVGQTYAEQASGAAFGPAVATDDVVRLVAFDVYDASESAEFTMYRPGTEVKENFLPEAIAGTLAAGVLAKVRAAYPTQIGVA